IRSKRSKIVAQWFGLIFDSPAKPAGSRPPPLSIRTEGVTLITGPSGAGKSTLLRKLVAKSRCHRIDLNKIRLSNRPVIDCFPKTPLPEVLKLLSQVGLAEAWTYLRTPRELSDGQRWRLRLAMAIHGSTRTNRRTLLVADEFAALLDRVTAIVIARALRRAV